MNKLLVSWLKKQKARAQINISNKTGHISTDGFQVFKKSYANKMSTFNAVSVKA